MTRTAFWSTKEICRGFWVTVTALVLITAILIGVNQGIKKLLHSGKHSVSESENITQIQFQSARGNCTGANCDFSSLFEQVLSIVKCPMVEGWSLGPAYFDIPRSLISYVDIKLAFEDNYLGSTLVEKKCNSCKETFCLNQSNEEEVNQTTTIAPDVDKQTLVELCLKNGSCVVCGVEDSEPFANRFVPRRVECLNQEFETEAIKLTLRGGIKKPCEVEAYGKLLVSLAVRELEVYLANGKRLLEGDEKVTQEHFIMNSIDSNFNTNPFFCFVSEEPYNGQALFLVPWSRITHIKLLGVGGGSAETLEGLFVFVCGTPLDSSCVPCGVAFRAFSGGWTTVHCEGGTVEGNHVKVKHSYQRLQFCEIQVFGMELAEKEKPVVRIETFFQSSNDEHMSQVEDEASRNAKFQFEVIEDVKPWEVTNGTCKTHGSNLSKYVSYKIPESIVKFVMILNCIREDCDQLNGAEVKVCKSSNLLEPCELCGKVEEAPKGEWLIVICAETETGKSERITLSNPVSNLQFCDFQVYGKQFGDAIEFVG